MTDRGKADALRRALRVFAWIVLPTGVLWSGFGLFLNAPSMAVAGPTSRAMKRAIGPDVSGMATIQPLSSGPKRRPARLAEETSSGVRMIFGARVFTEPRVWA